MIETMDFNRHFTVGGLLRFTWPAIAMSVANSVYSLVDGLFVSNYTGTTAFAAINLIWPFVAVISAIGFMFGAGGSALVAKTLGEDKNSRRANEIFSMITEVVVILGVVFSIIGVAVVRPVSVMLGASDDMLPICVEYGSILIISMIFGFLRFYFENLLTTAGKPMIGFWVTIIAGLANIVLDWLFIVVFGWGVRGAAIATAISFTLGGLISGIYFCVNNDSLLRLSWTRIEWRPILKASVNGLSELMSNVCLPLVGMIYNLQLMRYMGEYGVAIYGMIMYVGYIFVAVFYGFAIGVIPVVGYQYGAQNHDELRSLLAKGLWLSAACGAVMMLFSWLITPTITRMYFGYDPELCVAGAHAFRIFALCYLVVGINIFISAWFTALNNGLVSAAVSFVRSAFEAGAVLCLPLLLSINGIWLSSVSAETVTAVVGFTLLFIYRKYLRA